MQWRTAEMSENLVLKVYRFKRATIYYRNYLLRHGVDDLPPQDP